MARSTLRLYILGNLAGGGSHHTLITLAEFKDSRGLARVDVNPERIEDLAQNIRDLEAFIINGNPPFAVDRLVTLGGKLFALIFSGRVKALLERAAPDDADRELRPLEIVVEDKTIAGWPWEYVYNPDDERFLCQSFYPISRGIFGLFPRDEPLARPKTVRILFVVGASRSDAESNFAEQRSRLDHTFQRLKLTDKDAVIMDVMQAIEPFDIQSKLQENTLPYDILHFYGHAGFDAARDEGYLTFDKNDLQTPENDSEPSGITRRRLYAGQLGNLLAGRKVRLAFLNACETAVSAPGANPTRSSVAAALLSSGVPAVIATQFVMPDNSAHYFAAAVYKTLVGGGSMTEAMHDGRLAMTYDLQQRHPDWGIPVLYASYPDLTIFPAPRRKASRA